MQPRHEMHRTRATPTLHDLQREFAAALRDRPHDAAAWIADDGLGAEARLRVYANNSASLFQRALSLTYPVVERRVGTAHFAHLGSQYREAHPSTAGDLHEVGREFPRFLARLLVTTEYAWLAELASLEWAVADAAVAADASPLKADALAVLAPDELARACFALAPSFRAVAGTVPVLSVWRVNQPGIPSAPVDLARGAEHVLVHRTRDDVVELREAPAAEFALVSALARGTSLSAALDEASLPLPDLPGALGRLFEDGLVVDIRTDDSDSKDPT